MATTAMQLTIRFGASTPSVLEVIAPNGLRKPFSLPKKKAFVLTDITIVGPVSSIMAVVIGQGSGTTGTLRWKYLAPSLAGNVERSFTTGLVFTTPFEVIGVAPPGQDFTVLLSGFLRKA